MILLFGGTSETAPLATLLAEAGYLVLVSLATDNELHIGNHPGISRNIGKLDENQISQLITEKKIKAIVDATHPFALEVTKNVRNAASLQSIPYFRFERKTENYDYDLLEEAGDHEEAARRAFSYGKPVLLTTGSRNLEPYVEEQKKTGLSLYARVLPHEESIAASRNAGLSDDQIIAARGPFSPAQNIELLNKYSIGVLVSKDSGKAGNVQEKIDAASQCKCRVVLIRRPPAVSGYDDISQLAAELQKTVRTDS